MFTSPHPSSPWATLPTSAFVSSPASYDDDSPAASPDSDYAVPTLAFFKPATARTHAPVDYFSFQPHGIRSPFLPESYGQPAEPEPSFEYDDDDDDDGRSDASSFSYGSTLVDWAEHEHSLGPVFLDDDDASDAAAAVDADDDDDEFTPVHIEKVAAFFPAPPPPPALVASSSPASSSSSSSSSARTPPPPPAPSSAAAGPSPAKRAQHARRRLNSFEAVAFARWAEQKVHVDTPHPAGPAAAVAVAVVESPDGSAAQFNWRRE